MGVYLKIVLIHNNASEIYHINILNMTLPYFTEKHNLRMTFMQQNSLEIYITCVIQLLTEI